MNTSRGAVDWAGSYAGTLPCADCPGIRITLTLKDTGQYELSEQYLDRQPKPQITQGTFRWLPDNGRIQLSGDNSLWRVGENELTSLSPEGEMPTGSLAKLYVLKRLP